ncbi:hypothetical protein D9M70_471500 [compost metagenome]
MHCLVYLLDAGVGLGMICLDRLNDVSGAVLKVLDDSLNFLHGILCPLSQVANLIGNNGESSAGLTSASSFDCGI